MLSNQMNICITVFKYPRIKKRTKFVIHNMLINSQGFCQCVDNRAIIELHRAWQLSWLPNGLRKRRNRAATKDFRKRHRRIGSRLLCDGVSFR